MDNQKRENLLNLALSTPEEQLERLPDLASGYDESARTWEVVVQYQGDLSFLAPLGITITYLLFQYAILVIPQHLMDYVTALPEITYMEKPKSLFFADSFANSVSCIPPALSGVPGLSGAGVIVACIDSGIDYTLPDFRKEDGTTRLLALWDQSVPGAPPAGYSLGTAWNADQINEALAAPSDSDRLLPSRDVSGHGTAVMGIAAGGGGGDRTRQGVAWGADLLAVKLGAVNPDDLPRTTQLMQAIDYTVRFALSRQQPLALNLSFGNNYGSHSGTSLLETYLNAVSGLGRSVICIGSGNEGSAGRHASGQLREGETARVEFQAAPYEVSFSLQIWKFYGDQADISLVAPDGQRFGPLQEALGTARFFVGGTEVLLYYGMPSPYSPYQEIYLTFQGARGSLYVDSGVWTVELVARRVVSGSYDLWLPGGNAVGDDTRFYQPSASTTLTIPSTARYGITVGAYDPRLLSYASFSGRGFTRVTREVKPELVAPGVDIPAPRPGGGYGTFTGTSFAAPIVTGSCALMMEWGILRGHDPFLYGEKVKAYLIRGAKKLPSEREYPNERLGWGALCLQDSLPV